uniref:hypothetical protein n=1 Tax=Lactobacillus acidophilus TaxID=1579 RepID=UPI003F558B15
MREVILVTKYSITQMSIDELTDVSKQLIKAKNTLPIEQRKEVINMLDLITKELIRKKRNRDIDSMPLNLYIYRHERGLAW